MVSCAQAFVLLGLLAGTVYGSSDSSLKARKFPLQPIDRRIDDLGEESRLHSEDDVREYVGILLSKFELDEARSRFLRPLKDRLIQAEYSAVTHREKRIPESAVVAAFNTLMDSWDAPSTTRISGEEFQLFRTSMSVVLLPRSIERSVDGIPTPVCRPVEALYLIYLLQTEGGVSPQLRDAAKLGLQPKKLLLESSRPTRSELQLAPPQQGFGAYLRARSAHFAQRSEVDLANEAEAILLQLGI